MLLLSSASRECVIGVQVGFDRIVAGASAPSGQLNRLLGLLKEGGGVIVTPVIPSDLDKITKLPDGSVKTSLISKVRFSDLVVPPPPTPPG